MLVFSWAINFEVNWRALNSKDSWGHWQHVWLIMTHESTLTLVIAGIWWARNSAWQLKGKWFPLHHSRLLLHIFFLFHTAKTTRAFFSLWQAIIPSTFSVSLPVHPAIFHFFVQHSSDFFFFFLRNSTVSWVSALHKSLPLFSHLLSLKVYGVPSSMWAD